MLLDSNIIIYTAQVKNGFLREFIAKNSPYISALSYLEILGYHQLTNEDKTYFEEFFNASEILPISQSVIDQAVRVNYHTPNQRL